MKPFICRCVVILTGVVAPAALPAVVVADPPAGATDPKAFMPLVKGSKWVYSVKEAGFENGTAVLTNTCDKTEINGKSYYRIRNKWKYTGGSGYANQAELYTVTSDGVYLVGWTERPDNGTILLDRPACRMKFTTRPAEWQLEPEAASAVDQNGNKTSLPNIMGAYTQSVEEITFDGREVEAIHVRWTFAGYAQDYYYAKGIGLVRFIETELKNNRIYKEYKLTSVVIANDLTIGNITLGETVEKEASVETVEAVPGVVTEFEKSRTITREVSFSAKLGLSAEAEAKLSAGLLAVKGEVSTKVKGSIERALGEKLTDTETRKQTVKIDGTVLPKAKIIWIDVYRTGTVEVTTSEDKSHKVPFEFPVGTKLVIRKP
jgi:hypothetical protein